MNAEYIYDPAVDDTLDWELRVLLATCFGGPLFRGKRYNVELPPHRWIVRAEDGTLVAHAAVHDKRIGGPAGELRVGGVAEVCVHPAWRGRKLVHTLLDAAHAWMRAEGIPFSVLMGRAEVYGGLGYVPLTNPLRYFKLPDRQWITQTVDYAMVLQLGGQAWPAKGVIDLRCPLF